MKDIKEIGLYIIALLVLGALFMSAGASAESVKERMGDTYIIRLKPEYKAPPPVEEPEHYNKTYEESTDLERRQGMNSFCAGYYNGKAIAEMGTLDSTASLLFKNDFSKQQKLAVRLFTEHVNAYKRQGGIHQEFYDAGGRYGGNIAMSGSYGENGVVMDKKEFEDFCAEIRKGRLP